MSSKRSYPLSPIYTAEPTLLRCHKTFMNLLARPITFATLVTTSSKCVRAYSSALNHLHPKFTDPRPRPDDEIVVAMSSGVDSSVAAAMLARSYRNVRGVYMANWSQAARCAEQDYKDVQQVCKKIGIPCERVNFEREYWNNVFEPMIEGYSRGLTPNPDVGCNRHVKFGRLFQYLASRFSALPPSKSWWLATGHYARVAIDSETQEHCLLRGLSPAKDQSYYLSSIDPQVLSRLLMPIGHYQKLQIRDLAQSYNLHVASKPDSQGLCFVSQEHNRFDAFLNDYIAPKTGNFVTKDGKVWGQHPGIWHATVGQRARVSMPQGDPRYTGTWYILEKRAVTNELVIVRGSEHPALYKRALSVANWRWIARPSTTATNLLLQYQSLKKPSGIANIEWENEAPRTIHLTEPARAIAPGQVAVIYDGPRVLGSGTIVDTE